MLTIWSDESGSGGKAALPLPLLPTKRITQVAADTVAQNLKEVVESFDEILVEMGTSKSGFMLEEIEISLSVNAQGGVELLGKLSAGAQASIKVKLTRANAAIGKDIK